MPKNLDVQYRSEVVEALSKGQTVRKEEGVLIDNGEAIHFVGKDKVYRFSELGASVMPLKDYAKEIGAQKK